LKRLLKTNRTISKSKWSIVSHSVFKEQKKHQRPRCRSSLFRWSDGQPTTSLSYGQPLFFNYFQNNFLPVFTSDKAGDSTRKKNPRNSFLYKFSVKNFP